MRMSGTEATAHSGSRAGRAAGLDPAGAGLGAGRDGTPAGRSGSLEGDDTSVGAQDGQQRKRRNAESERIVGKDKREGVKKPGDGWHAGKQQRFEPASLLPESGQPV